LHHGLLSKIGKETVLFYFNDETNGSLPWGTPFMDASGALYGTAEESAFDGTVWRFTKKGGVSVLHQFVGGKSDGAYPRAGVVLDSKGNLYGDTEWGGGIGFEQFYGTVYELSGGTLTLLHVFSGSDGSFPVGTVLRDANGNLYGATTAGGSYGAGTVWEISP